MAEVLLKGVTKSFGGVAVLQGVSVTIADGSFVVLVGPSGCGKSTLLRLIAGLETPSAGSIEIGGRDVTAMTPQQRDIAMVFQSYALYPHMTVAQNMGFALKLRGMPKAQIDERVSAVAEKLSLGPLLQRYPKQLSGGQRQRVAMGRSIVRDPKVFLFDEPLSNLDAKLRVSMRAEIRSLHQSLGSTSVYVTHDQVEAMTMADTILVMDRGAIVQSGSPAEIYGNPNCRFVAEFIGSPSMNFVEGEVRGSDWIAPGDFRLPIRGQTASDQQRKVTVGFRPEVTRLATGSEAAAVVRVSVVENTGAEIYVRGAIGEAPVTIVSREIGSVPGDVIRVVPVPGKTLFFDTASGRRIDHVKCQDAPGAGDKDAA
jgi:multiple sugar transport system ATP-binding protein